MIGNSPGTKDAFVRSHNGEVDESRFEMSWSGVCWTLWWCHAGFVSPVTRHVTQYKAPVPSVTQTVDNKLTADIMGHLTLVTVGLLASLAIADGKKIHTSIDLVHYRQRAIVTGRLFIFSDWIRA